MAFMTVYDSKGKEHSKEPVDARECIDRLGWTSEPPKSKRAKTKSEPEKEEPKKLLASDLRGTLDKRNIPYKSSTNMAELEKLVKDSEPEKKA